MTLLIGCGSSADVAKPNESAASPAPKASNPATRMLLATMTDEGVECPAVRGAAGEIYTVPDMPASVKTGDRLNIEVPDPMEPVVSFCQQGQTIIWKRIELISPNGKVLKYWDK